MFQVIDSFEVPALDNSSALRLAEPLAAGLWYILDAQQTRGFDPPFPGQMATIRRPDGGMIVAEVIGVEVRHMVIGLMFDGVNKNAVPRLSEVEWCEPLDNSMEVEKENKKS